MSISLPGLARFGCDLSATVGGIPNFGRKSQSPGSGHYDTGEKRGPTPCTGHRRCSWAKEWLGISPGTGGVHQSIQQLRSYPTSSIPPATMGRSGTRGAWNPASRGSSPSRRALSANGHEYRDFECVPVWRFGNSRARPERGTDRSPIATSDSATTYITSWALWAADAAVNALPGRRRPRQ